MKRDMDKVRSVLLAIEELDRPFYLTHGSSPIGGTEGGLEMVEYLRLLESGGYLDKGQHATYRLTWEGHEFLDKVRDPEIWRKTKEGAGKVGSWSVKLLADMATGFIRAKATELGLPGM